MSANHSSVASMCFGTKYKDDVSFLMANKNKQLQHIYKTYQGIFPLPLAFIGLILSAIYFFAVLRAVRQRRVSRKCYVLLLNRSFGDCFACVMAIVISIYNLSARVVSRETTQFMDVLFMSSIWSAMVSYVALSLIKLYAVWKPLEYRKRVTMQRCLYLIALSWLVFAGFATYAIVVLVLVRVPVLQEWSGCRLETCVRYMYRTRNATVVFVYCLTILCFILTVIFIRRARKYMKQHHRKTTQKKGEIEEAQPKRQLSLKDRFPLWKLSINVGTFAVFHCFYPVFAAFLLVRSTEPCFFLLHFNSMMIFLGFVRLSLLLRAIIDPIVAFITDVQVRRGVISVLGLQSKIEPMSSKKRLFFRGATQRSEDNSSEAETKHTTATIAAAIAAAAAATTAKMPPTKSGSGSYIPDRASVCSAHHEHISPIAKAVAATKARNPNAGSSLKEASTMPPLQPTSTKAKEEGDLAKSRKDDQA